MSEFFNFINTVHVYPEGIDKSMRNGLIPVRKMVHDRGRSYYRTYWCKPAEIQHFNGTAPAIEYLVKTMDTQKDLMEMVESLEKYNTGLAAQIYNQMLKNGEQSIQIADKVMSTSEWMGNRETNLTAMLAGLKHLLNGKGKIDMGDLTKTYEEVSYQYRNAGLELKGTDAEGQPVSLKKLSVIQELVPMGWIDKVKDVGSAIRSNIKEGLKIVRVLYNKLGVGTIPPLEEELDFRRKENKGKQEQLYVSYQGKKVLTDAQKLALEGKRASTPTGTVSKLFTVDPEPSSKAEFKQKVKHIVKERKI